MTVSSAVVHVDHLEREADRIRMFGENGGQLAVFADDLLLLKQVSVAVSAIVLLRVLLHALVTHIEQELVGAGDVLVSVLLHGLGKCHNHVAVWEEWEERSDVVVVAGIWLRLRRRQWQRYVRPSRSFSLSVGIAALVADTSADAIQVSLQVTALGLRGGICFGARRAVLLDFAWRRRGNAGRGVARWFEAAVAGAALIALRDMCSLWCLSRSRRSRGLRGALGQSKSHFVFVFDRALYFFA